MARSHVLPLDLAAAGALEQLVGPAVANASMHVDAWVNNAGADILTGEGKSLTRRQKLDAVLDVDLRGTVLASWAAVDFFRARQRGGRDHQHVVGSRADRAWPARIPCIYSAAKGGIHAFSKSLARDVAPLVRVNVIAPGFIDTAFGDEAEPEWRAHVEQVTPLGRWGTPGGRGAGGGVSRVRRRGVRDRTGTDGEWWSRDVGPEGDNRRSAWRNKEPTYTEAQIAEKLATMPGWYYENGWIRRVYKTDGWQATLMLVNTVGYIAEAAYHHPGSHGDVGDGSR